MTDIAALKAVNAKRWAAAKLTRDFKSVAERLVESSAKQRYLTVSSKTGVPWWFIALVSEREYGGPPHWDKQLGQGDPLNEVSIHIPRGRGPFATWELGATDALVNCSPHAARNTDWSVGSGLTMLEQYNGLGPENHGIASGYIWAGTDQYTKGKYIHDGVWDPDEVDQQLGCAGILMAMMQLDPSIKFEGTVVQSHEPAPTGTVHDGAWLQNSLNKLGANPQLEVDGIVGPSTRNAVRAFQMAQGLIVDGLVGPTTFDALDKALATGKPVPTMPVPPDIILPPPGTKAREDLASTFWGRFLDLFRPKAH